MTLDWVPACDGFAIVACGDTGMTMLQRSRLRLLGYGAQARLRVGNRSAKKKVRA
jgi:hypothetical protein